MAFHFEQLNFYHAALVGADVAEVLSMVLQGHISRSLIGRSLDRSGQRADQFVDSGQGKITLTFPEDIPRFLQRGDTFWFVLVAEKKEPWDILFLSPLYGSRHARKWAIQFERKAKLLARKLKISSLTNSSI